MSIIFFKEVKMSISDIEHFGTIISGCEAINNGDKESSDARYAFAVLKLHHQDLSSITGQEGFLDSVKKGASTIKEWVVKLIKAIKTWLVGNKKEAKDIEAEYKELKTKFQKAKAQPSKDTENKADLELNIKTEDYVENLKDVIVNMEKVDGHKFEFLSYTINIKSAITDIESAVHAAEKKDGWELGVSVVNAMNKLSSEINDITSKLESWGNKASDDVSKLPDNFSSIVAHIARAVEILTKMSEHIKVRIAKQLDVWLAK